MIEFRQKDFSILSSTLRGAGYGAAIGLGARGPLFRNSTDKLANKFRIGTGGKDLESYQKKIDKLNKKKAELDLEIKKTEVDIKSLERGNNKDWNTWKELGYKKAELEDEKNKINSEINSYKDKIKDINKNNPLDDPNLKIVGGLTILGAAMGFLVGTGKEISTRFNNKAAMGKRLMNDLLNKLKSKGFKEGKDFTRDPKIANNLKTKICIVISKDSDDLSLRINYVNDTKLRNASKQLIGKLPKSLTVNEEMSDKYNDISITTISKSSEDLKLTTDIVEHFIRSGFPVYLIEVG